MHFSLLLLELSAVYSPVLIVCRQGALREGGVKPGSCSAAQPLIVNSKTVNVENKERGAGSTKDVNSHR